MYSSPACAHHKTAKENTSEQGPNMAGAYAIGVGQGPQCACCGSTSCRGKGGRALPTWHFTKIPMRRRLCDPCWVGGAFGCRKDRPTNERCRACRQREEDLRIADARAVGGARTAAQACTAAVPAWSPHGPALAYGPFPPYCAANQPLVQTNALRQPWHGSWGSFHGTSDAGAHSPFPPASHAGNGIFSSHTAGAAPLSRQDQPLAGGSTDASSWAGAPNAPPHPASRAGNSQTQDLEDEQADELIKLEAAAGLLTLPRQFCC